MKYNETMIIRGGKLIYAISLKDKATGSGREHTSYIYSDKGEVYFADGWLDCHEFDFSNESHQLAKEIFITELQADIKRRILELKQLQCVFSDLNLSECFGSVLEDNTRLLLEIKDEVAKVTENAITKEDVAEVIVDSVTPIALTGEAKKKRKSGKTEEVVLRDDN